MNTFFHTPVNENTVSYKIITLSCHVSFVVLFSKSGARGRENLFISDDSGYFIKQNCGRAALFIISKNINILSFLK